MVFPPTAPYDTLALVTALTRTALADYIAGINPNLSGTVNVASNGITVTWVSGSYFTFDLLNQTIQIGGLPFLVQQVNSATQLTLAAQAATGTAIAYTAIRPTGDIFADSQAYVVPTVNLAYRMLQDILADLGHPQLANEVILFAIPPTTNQDPSSQQWISWTQFFDGTNLWNPATLAGCPVLPQDFVSPKRLWQRQTATSVNFFSFEMAPDGLRAMQKTAINRNWDWRDDALYLPGATLPVDVRIRYKRFLADLAPNAPGAFSTTQIPIMRCGRALAFLTASIFVDPRGASTASQKFAAQGEEAAAKITNEWVKLQQRSSFHRKSWGERDRRRRYIYGG